jgi:hypothetical protein
MQRPDFNELAYDFLSSTGVGTPDDVRALAVMLTKLYDRAREDLKQEQADDRDPDWND